MIATKVPKDHGEVVGKHDDKLATIPSPVDYPHAKIETEKKDGKQTKISTQIKK